MAVRSGFVSRGHSVKCNIFCWDDSPGRSVSTQLIVSAYRRTKLLVDFRTLRVPLDMTTPTRVRRSLYSFYDDDTVYQVDRRALSLCQRSAGAAGRSVDMRRKANVSRLPGQSHYRRARARPMSYSPSRGSKQAI